MTSDFASILASATFARFFLQGFLLLGLGFGAGSVLGQNKFSRGLVLEDPKIYRTFPTVPRYRAYLPPEVDLSRYFPVPGYQGDQSSCTAWAVGYALRTYYQARIHRADVTDISNRFSPAFIYNTVVKGDCSSGISVSAALNLLKNDGVATLSDFPYDPNNCSRLPDFQLKGRASQFRIQEWKALLDVKRLDDLKGQLALGYPIVVGMAMPRSFEQIPRGLVYDARDKAEAGSGHAMVLAGYSDSKAAFKLINSWGTWWGDGGFAWVSYNAMLRYLIEAYVADPGSAIPDDPPPLVAEEKIVEPAPVVLVIAPPKPVDKPTPVDEPRPSPVVKPEKGDDLVVAPTPGPKPLPVEPKPAPKPSPDIIPKPKPTPPDVKPRPVSPAQIGQEVRKILVQTKCAQLGAKVTPLGEVFVSGFVGQRDDTANLARRIAAIPGAKASVEDVKVFPWPQCEALISFREPIEKHRGLAVRVLNGSSVLREGEFPAFEVTTPDFPSFLYVTYINAAGDAIHLHSPGRGMPKQFPPGRKIVIGDGKNGTRFRVAAPFGHEMVVVIASASPLFPINLKRPESETEREYLTSFRVAFLAKSAAGHSGRIVAAAATSLRTESR